MFVETVVLCKNVSIHNEEQSRIVHTRGRGSLLFFTDFAGHKGSKTQFLVTSMVQLKEFS